MNNVTEKKYIKSKVDYFNIIAGDLCEVVDVGEIYIKVVKIGSNIVHYLYNFEFDYYDAKDTEIWEAAVLPTIFFLAGAKSISAGRAYNDILLEIDGGELKNPIDMMERGDLAPPILINEVFKLIQDIDVDGKESMIDSILDGHMKVFIDNAFVYSFYIMNYGTLKYMVDNWDQYSTFVKSAHDLK